MKAVLCQSLTGYQDLTIESITPPEPADNEALIDVKMVALNFFDTLITKGKYQFKPELPFSPGGEMAGVISKLGDSASSLKPGDRVMGYPGWGALREQITMPANKLIKLPEAISFETAASLMITYGTAMHGLADRGNAGKGDLVAVLGAGGGAGLAAVEIAAALGATVIAVASDQPKLDLAMKHGATLTLNSSDGDLKQNLKNLASENGKPGGIDIVYDCVGGDLAEPALRGLNWGGRYLVVGFASGDIPAIPLNLIMLKGIHVQGVFWGRFIEEQPDDYKAHMQQLLNWVEEGTLTPHIDAVYPLEETVAALDQLASRKARGKLLVSVGS